MNPPSPDKGENLQAFGILLFVLGLLLALSVVFFPDFFLHSSFDSDLPAPAFVVFALFPVLAFTGGFLFFRGRQHAAKFAAKEISADSRPEVLYLRTFTADASAIKHAFPAYTVMKGTGYLATEEEQLTAVLQPFGTVEAIGRPDEHLPPPGANRLYVPGKDWQDVVKNKMLSARIIIIRAGHGAGLLWELETAVKTLNSPTNLLILAVRFKKRHYKSFAEKASSILPVPLPNAKQISRWREISGFFSFSKDWRPTFLPLKAPWFKVSRFNRLRAPFQYALRPVFEQFGLKWEEPTASPSTVASFVWSIIVLLISILAFLTTLASSD
jgi:hypothetical protein